MRPLVAALLALSLAGSACGSGDDASLAPPAETMAAHAAGFAAAESFSFQIGLEGPPVVIEETFTLEGIDGVFRAPDEAEAEVRVDVLGLTGVLTVLASGEEVWQKGPLTTEWQQVESNDLLTVRDLFASDGLEALLADDLVDLQRDEATGLDAFPGESFDVLRGQTTGDRLGRLTLGILDGEHTDVTLYLTEGEIRRIVLAEQASDSPRTWTIDLFGYGRPVEISPAP